VRGRAHQRKQPLRLETFARFLPASAGLAP